MSRFLGLVLMVFSGSVFAELIVHQCQGSSAVAVALLLAMLPLGLLFGLLATARHYFWSIFAAIVIAVTLALPPSESANAPDPNAPPRHKLELFVYFCPLIALLAGSFVGARLITHRVRAATQPQDAE